VSHDSSDEHGYAGGAVAQAVAAHAGDRVSRLTLSCFGCVDLNSRQGLAFW
jgi:hypothetical protein